jgi:hypothetical protein
MPWVWGQFFILYICSSLSGHLVCLVYLVCLVRWFIWSILSEWSIWCKRAGYRPFDYGKFPVEMNENRVKLRVKGLRIKVKI